MQKKMASKELYQGPIFSMSKDEVEIKGCIYERDVIHHNGGVGVLAMQDGKLLLVKQYRYAIQQYTMEVPAGKLEAGEDPATCGMRELEEESGYGTNQLHELCALYSTPGFCSEKIYLYWSDSLQLIKHPRAMDEDEEIEICWVSINDAYEMVRRGEIQDAKTIIAIQFALIHHGHMGCK